MRGGAQEGGTQRRGASKGEARHEEELRGVGLRKGRSLDAKELAMGRGSEG